jgi:hypothetical protein
MSWYQSHMSQEGKDFLGKLSLAQRDAVLQLNSSSQYYSAINEQVALGDKFHKEQNYAEEARAHRFVQEKLPTQYYDKDSKKAWNWNCKVIHHPDLYPAKK